MDELNDMKPEQAFEFLGETAPETIAVYIAGMCDFDYPGEDEPIWEILEYTDDSGDSFVCSADLIQACENYITLFSVKEAL